YTHGRGLIKVRAKVKIEKENKSGESIVITELPYQVNKARLIEKIAELVREKKIEGISDIRDESDREGIRVVIEIKRSDDPQVVLNNLYKHTQMETSFGITMLALIDGQPHVLNLRRMLRHFIRHRREVIVRRTNFELKKAEEKAHILQGMKIAVDHMDEIIDLIKSSQTPEEARQRLVSDYPLTTIQAQAILDMRLQKLTGLEREKLAVELQELLKEIDNLRAILTNEALITKIIKDELIDIRNKYADERRTEIVSEVKEITIEDLIADDEMVITFSHSGYIKRNSLSSYRSQKRGGKGLIGMETKEEDFVEQIFIGSTLDYILFFSNKGKLYCLKVFQIPEAGRTSKGKALVNLLPLSEGERISTAINIRDFKDGYLVMFTKNGIVKKTALKEFDSPRSGGIIAIKISDNDELISVKKTSGNDHLIIGTKKGLAIRFNETDVRDTGRNTMGVIGIRLSKDDEVVSADVVRENTYILTVTDRGIGKRTKIEDYPLQNRGGKGVISIKFPKKGGYVIGLVQVKEKDDVVLISSAGKLIRMSTSNIPVVGRYAQGVKLMELDEQDKVMNIERVSED
ncbi:MAG: DNA gyrase subunit A, partial [Thermodesulfovibrionales bacterium]|nr:DNA gyrase subunit A [Thermodesulfovibrionales bacterium]